MLKDLTAIKFSGANFTETAELDFFNPFVENVEKTTKGAFLYGRNGSGKSTIARAFKKIAGEEAPAITEAAAFDKNGAEIALSEADRKHLYVFDEEFVDKNVRLKEDHLETIVMLGQAADLSDKIEKAEEERRNAQKEFEARKKDLDEYLAPDNIKSPLYYRNKMGRTLRGNESWSERDRRIKGKNIKTQVHENTFELFAGITPGKNREDLTIDFRDKLEELQKAKSGTSAIREIVPRMPEHYFAYRDKEVRELLAEKIEKPELSERERKLIAIRTDELNDRLELFKNDDVHECPYCFQPLSAEYKSAMAAGIEKVLSKAVEAHQDRLAVFLRDPLVFDLEPFQRLPGIQQCAGLLEKLNAAIEENDENLDRKRSNPFEPVIADSSVGALASQLKTAFEELEKSRAAFNAEAERTDPIIAELNIINSEIAYWEIIEDYRKYEAQSVKKDKAEALCNEAERILNRKTAEIEELNAQRRNIKLAVDFMNACMKYIFFAENRLGIECENGVYKLLSHGKRVKPKDISVGERNIIGLSYFFTSILQEKEEKDAYGEEYLLVIDDPVSSFDYENRVGILSFLRYILCRFLEGNRNTKALLMTHDIMTFFDFWKIFDEIKANCDKLKETVNGSQRNVYPNSTKINRFELANKTVNPFCQKRQEYTEIIRTIYEYASGQVADDEHDLVIGNMMRQALEAYATFVYKKKIEDVSLDQDILNQLPESFRPYYRNLMYRLVLHGGSHREEQVKAMQDFRFFSLISRDEKVRTAKDILCFLFLLNRIHILKHLEGCKGNAEQVLTAWCNAINTGGAMI